MTLNSISNRDQLMKIVESAPNFKSAPKFNGFASWRYISADSGVEIYLNGLGAVEIKSKALEFLSQSADDGCLLTGDIANEIFEALAASKSPLVAKVNSAIPGGVRVSLLNGRLSCRNDDSYGNVDNKKVTCNTSNH
ncbi:MAG: hypothetical protein V4736_06325 [Bdellovibrionota bacterium]